MCYPYHLNYHLLPSCLSVANHTLPHDICPKSLTFGGTRLMMWHQSLRAMCHALARKNPPRGGLWSTLPLVHHSFSASPICTHL
jgi:hypothetical protein